MSPDSLRPGSVRPSAVVNAAMRGLWVDGVLTDPEAYQLLLVEWAEAMRAEQDGVVEAA